MFLRVDNLAQAVRVSLSRPYREPVHLAKLLAERLVQVDPGFGIETARLTASWVEALTERQTVGRHIAADGSEVDVSQLVDTLGLRLGHKTRYSVSLRWRVLFPNAPCAACRRCTPREASIG